MQEPTSDTPTVASALTGDGGTVAGRYAIRGRLGRGASKEVYLAYDELLDREVAIAIVVAAGGGDAARARVTREAQVTGRLGDHPNVITVYDTGEHEGVPFLVLRCMGGGSLSSAIARQRPSIDDAIRLGREIASALAHAHAHGIVHRDVKPDNVWLAADGSAALGDFGIAYRAGADRLTAEGSVVGTPRYVSPEQARGAGAGPASDLYALGITLYEMLTGRTPFADDDPQAVLAQHLVGVPVALSQHDPAIPPALEQLVLDLLAKRPEDRPGPAAAVADALASIGAASGDYAPSARGNLVGREPIMARLTVAWEEALAGRPRIVALSGEPGIGKTRCAEEIARRVRRTDATVAWGLCAEQDGASAYRPWTRVLRDLGPAQPGDALEQLLGRDPDGVAKLSGAGIDEARFRLFDGVVTRLELGSGDKPLLVVLEDLHWADRSSVELLLHVARELRSSRTLIVVTTRAAGSGDDATFARALAELARQPAFERLELRGLDAGEVGSYIELVTGRPARTAVAGALHERTGGNPFYVSEVVRLLSEEGSFAQALADGPLLPDAVRDVVTARLERLPARTRAAVDVAAVVGHEFDIALVARAARLSRAELLEALEPASRQHVVASGSGWSFTHAIVRDAVYHALHAARRADLHAQLAALLRDRRARGRTQPAAEYAHHFLEAARAGGEPEPAIDASIEAAAEAVARLAHAEAAVHYDAALEAADLADLADDLQRCRILLRAADAHRDSSQFHNAERRYGEAASVARRAGSAQLLAEAALGYTEWQSYGSFDRAAVELLNEALAGLAEPGSALRAALLGRLALRLHPQRDQVRRESLLDEAIAMARRVDDPRTLTRLLAQSSIVHWTPSAAERRSADVAETLQLARTCADHDAALWAHTIRFADRFRLGDIAAADSELDAYAGLARDLRNPYYGWCETMMRATRAIFGGRLEEGERLSIEAVERNRLHDPDAEQEHTVQMLTLAVARGRPGDTDPGPLHEFAERYPELLMWRSLAAFADAASGAHAEAREGFEALARDDFRVAAVDRDSLSTLCLAAETCAVLGDERRAATLHELLLPDRDHVMLLERGWGAWGAVAHQLGLLASALGDEPLARQHFDRALQLHRGWRARPWELRTLLACERLGLGDRAARAGAQVLAAELGVRV